MRAGKVSRQDKEGFQQAKYQTGYYHKGKVRQEAECALDEQERQEGHDCGEYRGKYCREHFHSAINGGFPGITCLLEVREDVLCNHDAVIYENPNHYDHPKEAYHIDRETKEGSDHEHAQEGRRNAPGHPEGQTEAQK